MQFSGIRISQPLISIVYIIGRRAVNNNVKIKKRLWHGSRNVCVCIYAYRKCRWRSSSARESFESELVVTVIAQIVIIVFVFSVLGVRGERDLGRGRSGRCRSRRRLRRQRRISTYLSSVCHKGLTSGFYSRTRREKKRKSKYFGVFAFGLCLRSYSDCPLSRGCWAWTWCWAWCSPACRWRSARSCSQESVPGWPPWTQNAAAAAHRGHSRHPVRLPLRPNELLRCQPRLWSRNWSWESAGTERENMFDYLT